jgi:hypothetical protein
MEGNQKPKRDSRISAFLRRKKPASASSTQTTPGESSQESPVESAESADTQKTQNRYNDAAKFLQDSIETRGGERWQSFRLSKLGGEMEDFRDSQLREQIDEALKVLNVSIENQDALGKCKHIMQCMFTALSPLARNLINIASTASNVNSFTICVTFI